MVLLLVQGATLLMILVASQIVSLLVILLLVIPLLVVPLPVLLGQGPCQLPLLLSVLLMSFHLLMNALMYTQSSGPTFCRLLSNSVILASLPPFTCWNKVLCIWVRCVTYLASSPSSCSSEALYKVLSDMAQVLVDL